MRRTWRLGVVLALVIAGGAATLAAGEEGGAPSLAALVKPPSSELRDVVERYSTDHAALLRRYDSDYSPARRQRFQELYSGWRARLRELPFDSLSQEGKVDYVLLDHRLEYETYLFDRDRQLFVEMEALLPFAGAVVGL